MANEIIRIYRGGTSGSNYTDAELLLSGSADVNGLFSIEVSTVGWSTGSYTITVTSQASTGSRGESLHSLPITVMVA